MKITRLFEKNPRSIITIGPRQTIRDALKIMNEKRIGALMVVDDDKVAGIMTERDILTNIHKMQSYKEDKYVADIMTPRGKFIEGDASSDLQAVMQIMTDRKVRHLPIFNNGMMIGMVSIGDVIKALLEAADEENQLLKDYIGGSY